ncbi:MAG: large subunit ribosomal protein L25, partial [Flavobacteriales bacterium]
MKAVKLSGSLRTSVGKTHAASVRATGMVPGVIYGGEKQVSIQIKENDINKIVFTPKVNQFKINVDGTEYGAILKDIQQHPVTDRVIHFDFQEIVEGKDMKMKIPVRLKGNSIGVKNGGGLRAPNRTIMIQGMPDNFPDEIVVDIEALKIGQSIKVGDIN